MLHLIAIAAGVFVATLALTRLFRARAASAALVDLPNHRSLHDRPVPKVGGLAMLISAGAAAALFGTEPPLVWCAAFLLLVSVVDDARNLAASTRLAAHSLAAIAFLWVFADTAREGWGFTALGFVTLVWMANLYNFMDGADGLAGGMTAFGFGSLAIVAHIGGHANLSLLAGVFAVAALAFLCFNFPPASVFMGDAGSVPLGFLAAALGYVGFQRGAWPYWFPALVFAPFIVDASYTLVRRALRGERVWVAHREHLYQRLVLAGWSHRRLALVAYGIMCGVDAAAIFALRQSQDGQIALIVATLVLLGLLVAAAERKAVRPAVANSAEEAHR